MKVSVYVPCFNGERYIAQCIASLLTQTRRPDEIIVVDDGSTDRSPRVASAYPVRLIRHEQNQGLGATRSTGVRAATGDLIASIDADCFARRDWLERLTRILESTPDAIGAAGQLIEANYDRIGDRWRTHHLPQNHGANPLPDVPYLHGANTLFRREALLAAGGYDQRFRTNGEDFDICRRLKRKQPAGKLVYDSGAVVMHLKEDTVASVLRARFRYYYYPMAIYRPCDRVDILWRRLRQTGRANWRTLRFDVRHKFYGLALVSAVGLVYVAARFVADYARNRIKRVASGAGKQV
ncbi:MAG: glycosyltransferase [Alphaproteobacteria bacterium]|nr:glycosyltransferase [Alphaproteobacteria bacterium]